MHDTDVKAKAAPGTTQGEESDSKTTFAPRKRRHSVSAAYSAAVGSAETEWRNATTHWRWRGQHSRATPRRKAARKGRGYGASAQDENCSLPAAMRGVLPKEMKPRPSLAEPAAPEKERGAARTSNLGHHLLFRRHALQVLNLVPRHPAAVLLNGGRVQRRAAGGAALQPTFNSSQSGRHGDTLGLTGGRRSGANDR